MESDDGYYSGNPSLISLEQSLEDPSKHQIEHITQHEVTDLGATTTTTTITTTTTTEATEAAAVAATVPVVENKNESEAEASSAHVVLDLNQGPQDIDSTFASYDIHDQDVQSIPGTADDFSIGGTDSTDVDSAYDNASLIGDDTRSLASSIVDYRVEHGRRYHAFRDGAYWGPNDEPASDIQDLAHHIYLLTLDNKLFLAPIRDVHNVLDIGTGTGIWAIDMADTFPSAAVVGVDLSPIQPSFVPPNCTFEIDDVTQEWTWPEDHFDFIHIREMFGSIPDWDSFFEQCFRCTKRGGWVEIVEHSVEPTCDDETQPPSHFYWEWGGKVVELGNKIGKSFTIWKEAKERLERAGFVDIVEVSYKWPMNAWSNDVKQREIGRWNQLRLYNGVEGFMLRLLTGPGEWSFERAQIFLSQMRSSLRDYSCHSYLPGTVVYGRKP